MLIGQIMGTVVSTKKDEKLVGLKFHAIKTLDLDGKPTGSYIIAVDSVGAGVGEVVLYSTGSSARQTDITKDKPVDAVIMAIIDEIEVGGRVKYHKS